VASVKGKQSKNSENKSVFSEKVTSEFIKTIDKYLQKSNWTNQQLMADIKVGQTQFYRWQRGENIPTKALVNRIAVSLAIQINKVFEENNEDNHFYATDKIDGILNELLVSAGYSASIKGKGADSGWDEIDSDGSWRVGYINIPGWAEVVKEPSKKLIGKAVDYVEQVGRLLGITTTWERYYDWEKLSTAIAERKIHAVAPFLLNQPGRTFKYQFSNPCSDNRLCAKALISSEHAKIESLEDLPTKDIELIYIKDEIGEWIAGVLGNSYKSKGFANEEEAISYFISPAAKSENRTPIYLSENIGCNRVRGKHNVHILNVESLSNVWLSPVFGFHQDETKLKNTINYIIGMIPKMGGDSDV
jgi:transcriptional regulator with XRE-family HTH domain